jgi:L-ascorbate metabolism protein UlaG (beta-lactamase superfamily)
MIITHHGAEFFKVSFGDTTLAFNPISKKSKLKPNRFGADIALITNEHPDMNGVEQVGLGEKSPFIIRGPGEYEIKDVLIKGFPITTNYGGEERINTAYLVKLEKMHILFLGATNTSEFSKELNEALDDIDILFVPIGGEGVLEPKAAHKLAVSISPRLIIPMHYVGVGMKDAIKEFLKQEGTETNNHKPEKKLTIKNKDLEGKQNEIVVFTT